MTSAADMREHREGRAMVGAILDRYRHHWPAELEDGLERASALAFEYDPPAIEWDAAAAIDAFADVLSDQLMRAQDGSAEARARLPAEGEGPPPNPALTGEDARG